ncbi:MAG: GGDEF domain-containing protein [Clostridia bacterium]|nr:GGDEF domain-containing protein [Clostridia bacterium]
MQAQVRKEGLSLKTTSVIMMIVSLIITVILVITAVMTIRSFRAMDESTRDFIRLEKAANELMDASDYLTEEVQCFTVIGDRIHMDNYFTEANVNRRREHALNVMEDAIPGSPALEELKAGMAESLSLMNREYYAMRLMLEAAGDPDQPEVLKQVVLSEEDSALTPSEKILLAQRMTHDSGYYDQKNRIRDKMAQCLNALQTSTQGMQLQMEYEANRNLVWMTILIFIQTIAMFTMMWLTTHLGVNPVLRAVDHIRKDQSLPIIGAAEFRYLAGAYNSMYSAYKKSIENLSFQASHDELTGAYNRAGYDLIKSSLDLSSTAMLLFDADQFKSINDRYGHETGDNVLIRIASVLKKSFRSDDYICRIGGDEFVVFMVHISGEPESLIEHKVRNINQDLSECEDGLPAITLSAGVSFDPECSDPKEMFRRADTALYFVKDHGRDGCCFWSRELSAKPEEG